MRTIKFRGKSKFNSEWVYGDLVQCMSDDIKIVNSNRPKDLSYRINDIQSDTVGQFTGLCDNNGVEIYEGDIVELLERNGMPNICKVEMCEKGYWCVSFGIHERIILGYIDKNQIIVIGNIHDNPELLKNNNLK